MASFQLKETAIARHEAGVRAQDQRLKHDQSALRRESHGDPTAQKEEVSCVRVLPSPSLTRHGHHLRHSLYALTASVIMVIAVYGFLLQSASPLRWEPEPASNPDSTMSELGPRASPALESREIDQTPATSFAARTLTEQMATIESEIATLSEGPRSSETERPPGPSAGALQDRSTAMGHRKLDPEEIKALMERGQRFVAGGDLTSARLVFRRAAEAGDAAAALALGASYDPEELAKLRLVGLAADVETSRAWYQRAKAFGSLEATRRLDRLSKQ